MKKHVILLISFLFLFTACGVEEVETNLHEDSSVTKTTSEVDHTGEKEKKKEKETASTKQETKKQASIKKQTNALSPLTIHYIDVGQADATLFTYENKGKSYTILYDTGDWKRKDTVEYLKNKGITTLDLVIISHPDADHIGQLPEIIDTFDVSEVWMSGNESSSRVFQESLERILTNDIDYHEPRTGEDYKIGNLHLKIIHPKSISGKANEESISIKFTYGNEHFLFTGDADVQAESEMIATGIDLKSHVLQLGHHGSDTSNGQEFIDTVQPEIAVVSAGTDNPYGHPHKEVITRLKKAGIKIYSTATDGNILLTTDGKTYSIKSEKNQSHAKKVATDIIKSKTPNTTKKQPSKQCVDINQATMEELQDITHIGEKRAEEIIAKRPYRTVDELSKVNGIGDIRIQEIKEEGIACVK